MRKSFVFSGTAPYTNKSIHLISMQKRKKAMALVVLMSETGFRKLTTNFLLTLFGPVPNVSTISFLFGRYDASATISLLSVELVFQKKKLNILSNCL